MSSAMAVAPRRGADIWRQLHGIICVFKPAGCTVNHCMRVLRHRLAVDLNSVEDAAAAEEEAAAAAAALSPGDELLSGGSARDAAAGVAVSLSPGGKLLSADPAAAAGTGAVSLSAASLSAVSRRLLLGPAFQPEDVRVTRLASLPRHMSGPLLLGVNDGTRVASALRSAGPQVRVHQVTARLGVATDSRLADGRPTDRAAYGHVTRGRMEAVLSGLQAAHQRAMFESSGLPVTSQAAYELAQRGPVRPARGAPPVLYGLRCVQFAPPYVTLEIHGCNESGDYLLTLVDDLGRQLRTAAVTVHSRCTRHGPFTLEHALLMKHWRLEHVQRNMRECMVTAARALDAQMSLTLHPLS